jgi:DivIVA domain-containing protein
MTCPIDTGPVERCANGPGVKRHPGGGSVTNDLDLPLLPSAEQIRRREFATVRRGYDPDQVREYLQGVAGQVETLERELRGPRKETKAQGSATPGGPPAPPVTTGQVMTPATPAATTPAPTMPSPAAPAQDPYEVIAKRFAGVLATADKEATAALAEAKAEADRILQEARSEADRIKLDAQGRAEQAKQQGTDSLAEAKHEAERILGSLSERREALVTQMHDMQSKLLSVAKELESSIDAPGSTAAPEGNDPGSAPTDGGTSDDVVDPRYEDMWALPKGKKMVDIPDLAALDVDFEEEPRRD